MAELLRVLQVSSGLDPRTGGTATAAVNVALAARRAGLAVTLAYPTAPGEAERLAPALGRLKDGGVRALAFPFWRLGGARAERWAISRALAKVAPIVVSELKVRITTDRAIQNHLEMARSFR